MEKSFKFYTYIDGINDIPFPSKDDQIEIFSFSYDAKRMGGSPSITGSVLYRLCLDEMWTGKEYVSFNGEKYFLKQTPSSSYSNEDQRYKHQFDFSSERIILDNTYFFDVVTDQSDNDRYVSNSSNVNFFGDIHEFATRLNYSLKYSRVGYSVVVDSGISSEAFMMSFEDQFFSQVLQSIFEVYQIPYYYVGKVIHIGFTNNVITKTFKYGSEDSLLSISKNNANYKIVNRITGVGSTDNIPYYYPNPSDDRAAIGDKWITPSTKLMPSIYRDSRGAERFYNAKNNTYTIPETGGYYIFSNQYTDGNPKEHKVSFDNIKPTIKEMTNALGQRIDIFEAFDYDTADNDDVDKEGNYIHPYFFGKLRKMDGSNGFNLFEQVIKKGEMIISMTSGNCGACNWIIGVDEDTQKNPVQVHTNGDLLRDKDGNVLRSGVPQDSQNNTKLNSVWVALKKDIDTFGVVMPNVDNNYKPTAKTDTFSILNINLPQAYITSAETKLKEEIIKYLATNNSDKFTFSISFSRIFFAENPDVLALLNENARLQIEYDSNLYELYVSSYSYKKSNNEALPQITVELADTLTINKGSLQTSLDSVKQDILSNIGNVDFLKQGLKHFVRKDIKDYAKFIEFREGIDVGGFESLLSGGTFRKDADGKSYIEVDRLYVRLKAIFENLEIKRTTYVGGEQIASPAAMKCIKVEDKGTYYRCYYLSEQDGRKIQNEFVINDQAICKESNLKSGSNVSNRYYWRLVVGVGDGYIDLSKEKRDLASNDVPLAGDDIVQLGNTTDVTRQKAIIQSTVSLDSPSIKLLAGINSFSLEGKSIISQGFDGLNKRATFKVYGETYIGNPDGSSFIRYTPENGVEINAKLSIGTKFGEGGNTLLDSLTKATEDAVKASSKALTDYASEVTKDITGLQDQIDGAIETWFYDPSPTLLNKPAVDWTTPELKNQHLGDLYYSKEGKAYRFQMSGSSYIWQVLADSDISKALAEAKKAQDTADGKRKIFVRQPLNTEDYAIGDLWVNATYSTTYNNDLLRAKTSKAVNSAFSIAHWELASKYTDDTKAHEAIVAAGEANAAAGAAKDAADAAAESVTTLNKYVDGAFKDGVITESESQAIAIYINTINNNKLSIDNQYAKLYANIYLDGSAKSNLLSSKTALDTATTNLLDSINTAIADKATTVAERADVDAKFALYNTANATFSTRVEEANKAIQDKLKTYSDSARDAANAAQTTANSATSTANGAVALLADMANDNKLTSQEKQYTKQEWDIIVSEKTKNDLAADKYGVSKTLYTSAYTALSTYITPLLASLTTTTDIVGDTFRTSFKAYYDARTDLLNAISSKSKDLADAAQTKADSAATAAANAKTAADNAQSSANTANTSLSDIASDSKLTATEKQQTKKEWDVIVSEKPLNNATAIKFAVSIVNYDATYTALNTYITPLLASLTTTTDIVGATFRSIFKAYYDARTSLLNSISEKAKAIADTAQTKANEAATAASGAQATASDALSKANGANALLADIASDSKLTATEKQQTKKEWDVIVSEKPKNDASADFYGVSKAAYGTTYNSLSTYITPLLTSLTTTTDIVGTTFRSTFKSYYDARTDLLNAIAKKAKDLADAAQNSANTANSSIAGYSYIKTALGQKTEVTGGLVLTSNVTLGQTINNVFTVKSGINGIFDATKPGSGISYWSGGAMKDLAEDYPLPWAKTPVPTDPSKYATSVIRMDGTVYHAKGNFWIDIDGKVHCDPLSFFVGEEQVGDILTLFKPVKTSGKVVGIRQEHPFEDGTGKGRLLIGGFILSEDNNGNLSLTKANGTAANFYTTGGLSAKGLSEGSGGGGGGGIDAAMLWAMMGNSGTEQISKTHLTTALNGYATEQWVTNKAYLSAGNLVGYATQSWVESKGYLIATNADKTNWNLAFTNNHTHANKSVLDGVTSGLITNWNTSFGWGNHASAAYAKASALNNYILKSQIGVANGVAPLDAAGLISSSYLPSYVDDVLEFAALANLPTTGEAGKIYVTINTNLTYRWTGSQYVEISKSLALGETNSTAYAGDKGKAATDAINVLQNITISAGTGLTGGGNLTANRTLALAASGVTAGTYGKVTVDAYGRVTVGASLVESDLPALSIAKTTGLQANLDTRALKTTKVIAGTGLAGGGTLAADNTLSLGASGIAAGTYIKTTVDIYGRVTGSASFVEADIPLLSISKVNTLQTNLDSRSLKTITVGAGAGLTGGGSLAANMVLNVISGNTGITVNADNIVLNTINALNSTDTVKPLSAAQGKILWDFITDLFEKVNTGTSGAPVWAIRAKYGLYTDQFLSAKGLASGSSGGGGGGLDTVMMWAALASSGNEQIAVNHMSTALSKYVLLTDARLTNSRPASDVSAWAKVATKPVYTFAEITARPTTISGYGITDAVLGTDSRLTNARSASDVYAWAKASVKPSYNYAEVGAMRTNGRVVSDCNHADFRVSGSYGFSSLPTNAPSGLSFATMIVSNNLDVGLQIAGGYSHNRLAFRGWATSGGTYYPWNEVIHSANYTSYAVSITTDQTISGVKTFNAGTFRLSNTESNVVVDFSKQAVTGLGVHSISALERGFDFTWYSTSWKIGSIRGGGADTVGFGIANTKNVLVARFTDAALIAPSFVKSGSTSSQLLRGDGEVAFFNWSGQSGQPTWLWGGNTQHTYQLYNPSNFRVANANTVGDIAASNLLTKQNWSSITDGRYLPLTGGTVTGIMHVFEIDALDGNGLVMYQGGNSILAAMLNTTYIRSGNTNLLHRKSGVGDGKIWDEFNDGAGSGLDADMLDGMHAVQLLGRSAYSFNVGCLVKTNIVASSNAMITVTIFGNSYTGVEAINTTLQFYNYSSGDNIIEAAATHFGYNLGNIEVFNLGGFVHLWFKQHSNFQSFSVNVMSLNQTPDGYNRVTDITNVDLPTTGVTRKVTVVPIKGAYTHSNVASATILQNSRTLWGRPFNGSANISGNLDSVGVINGSGVLTLNGVGEINFKIGSDSTKSLVLNTSSFKPFDAATNVLNLGMPTARWKTIFGISTDLTGSVTAGARSSFVGGLRAAIGSNDDWTTAAIFAASAFPLVMYSPHSPVNVRKYYFGIGTNLLSLNSATDANGHAKSIVDFYHDGTVQWHNQQRFNGRLIIGSDGKVFPHSTNTRRAGMYGTYDATKIGHIWSMGVSYTIADDGADFGNLYGLAYKYISNVTGGTMAGGHQMVWATEGVPRFAAGSNGIWTSGYIEANGYAYIGGNVFAGRNRLSSSGVPTIDLAVGDSDTGIRWNSDGNISLMANGVGVANIFPSGFTTSVNITAPGFIGNASSSTKLQTTRAINGTNFDGTAAITTATWGTARTLTVGSDCTGAVSVNGSANFTVPILVNVATKLRTARGIFGISFDGTSNVVGRGTFYGTISNGTIGYNTGGLEVREAGLIGNGATADVSAPRIGFHWGNRFGRSLISATDGFKFQESNESALAKVHASAFVGSLTGTANNSLLLSGLPVNMASVASTVVARNTERSIFVNYVNSTAPDSENNTLGQIMTTTGSDGYLRKVSIDKFVEAIDSYTYRVDLSNSIYNTDTWYPCTLSVSNTRNTRIRIWSSLSTNKPVWSSHPSGFSIQLEWSAVAGGWGSSFLQSTFYNSWFSFTPLNPCGGVESHSESSQEIVWLRGGGIYNVNNGSTNKFIIHKDGYQWRNGDYNRFFPVRTSVQIADPTSNTYNSILITNMARANSYMSNANHTALDTWANVLTGSSNIKISHQNVLASQSQNIINWGNTISDIGYITRYTIGSMRTANSFGRMMFSIGTNDAGTSGVQWYMSSDGSFHSGYGRLLTTTFGNTLTIGSQNTSYTHFENSVRRSFYFSDTILVNGDLNPYSTADRQCGTEANRWANVHSSEYYATGWFRNRSSDTGLYNQVHNIHIRGRSGHWYIDTNLNVAGNVAVTGAVTSATRIAAIYDANVAGGISCDNWFRNRGTGGWLNATYGGGWHMDNADSVKVYGNKVVYNDGARGWGIGGHNIGLKLYSSGDVGINLANDSFTWGIYSNSNGSMYFGRRSGNANNTSGSYYMQLNNSELYITGAIRSSTGLTSGTTLTVGTSLTVNTTSTLKGRATFQGGITTTTITSADWFRLTGNGGFYFETHGGGIQMSDTTWVRVYNSKQFRVESGTDTNGSSNASIFTTGGIHAAKSITAAGSISAKTASDIRLKKNFTLFDANKLLLSLGAVTSYEYNSAGLNRNLSSAKTGRHIGLIYQNVRDLFPQMSFMDSDGYGGLNYINTDYINLIAASAQQTYRLAKDNRSEIDKLREKVDELEKEIKKLRAA